MISPPIGCLPVSALNPLALQSLDDLFIFLPCHWLSFFSWLPANWLFPLFFGSCLIGCSHALFTSPVPCSLPFLPWSSLLLCLFSLWMSLDILCCSLIQCSSFWGSSPIGYVPRMSALFFHRPPICERATDHTYTKGCGHLGRKCGWDQV